MMERSDLYGWSFRLGTILWDRLCARYGEESAKKRFRNVILNLRSESLPGKFRRELVNTIVEIVGDEASVGIREEIKSERRWTIDEFYRYTTAIIAGLYDALQFKIAPAKGGEVSA
jgi:hypothetical protein